MSRIDWLNLGVILVSIASTINSLVLIWIVRRG